jgi:amino-acid N-acetyltransferase
MSAAVESRTLAAPPIRVEPAGPADAYGIAALLRRCAPETVVVPEREIRRHCSRYVVVRDEELGIVASAAVHELSPGVSELRSLAVDPRSRGRGLGPGLVRRIARVMQRRGYRLLCVTLRPRFFERFGFRRIPLDAIPRKGNRPAIVAGRPRVAMIRWADAGPLPAGTSR